MKRLMINVAASSKELSNVRNMVLCGLLIAIKLVIGLYSITVTPYLKISFSFLASAVIGMMFGPVVGAVCGGITDILGFMIKPMGPFYIAFTFIAVISGSLYGFLLYKKKITLTRCIITELIMMVFINLILNTYFSSLLYGKGFMAIIYPRLIKNLCQLPVNIAMLYTVLTFVNRITKSNNLSV